MEDLQVAHVVAASPAWPSPGALRTEAAFFPFKNGAATVEIDGARCHEEARMEILVGWLVLSIVIGLVARTRGDAFLVAFLWAFFLSPLVGFAVTMLKLPATAKARQPAPSSSTT
jgi:hypothetical protein